LPVTIRAKVPTIRAKIPTMAIKGGRRHKARGRGRAPRCVIEQRPETTVVQLSGGPMAEFPNTTDAVPVQVPPIDEQSNA
jgi:hypothetical protein